MFAYEKNSAELKALLLKADLKVTMTRLTILHILRSAQRELTVTEILYSPQQQLKKLSCAGIYQALRQLERAGLVANSSWAMSRRCIPLKIPRPISASAAGSAAGWSSLTIRAVSALTKREKANQD